METGTNRSKNTYLAKDEKTISFPLDKTALLVIDPVNDFLSEGGAAYEETKNTLGMHNVIDHLKKTIEGARKHGIPVLFGPMAYTEEDYADEKLQKRSGINRLMFEKKMFLAGSWGADFHPELQPQKGDIILLPHKSCDVFTTDLPEHLERLNITHLIIAGMTANLCCESTARHAMEAGYDVVMIKDAMGAETIPSYEAAVHINLPLISNALITTKEFLQALQESSPNDDLGVKKGDKVIGSDNGEVGTVKEVVYLDGKMDGYMLVPKGIIFKSDIYIPIDAITKKAGDEVFINVPKIMIDSMPWSEKPTQESSRAKKGSPSGKVKNLYRSKTATALEKEV